MSPKQSNHVTIQKWSFFSLNPEKATGLAVIHLQNLRMCSGQSWIVDSVCPCWAMVINSFFWGSLKHSIASIGITNFLWSFVHFHSGWTTPSSWMFMVGYSHHSMIIPFSIGLFHHLHFHVGHLGVPLIPGTRMTIGCCRPSFWRWQSHRFNH